MTRLEVEPAALVTAAAAVRCFSRDLFGVTFGGWPLGALTDEFCSRWASALEALSADADDSATALREAAADYADLERLLVPR